MRKTTKRSKSAMARKSPKSGKARSKSTKARQSRQYFSEIGGAKKPSRTAAGARKKSRKSALKTSGGSRSRTSVTRVSRTSRETPTRELLSDIAKVGRQIRRRVKRAL